jgi:hypothetical protein
VADVSTMLERGLVDPARLRACYDEIEPGLYPFPALDAADFRRSLEEVVGRPS